MLVLNVLVLFPIKLPVNSWTAVDRQLYREQEFSFTGHDATSLPVWQQEAAAARDLCGHNQVFQPVAAPSAPDGFYLRTEQHLELLRGLAASATSNRRTASSD